MVLQAQLSSQARPAQHVLPVRRSSCSRVVCQGFKRGMQQTSSAPASTTATTSRPPEAEAQVSIAVPIEQAPAAKQQTQSRFGMAWILVAAAVAAGLVFKKLKSNDPSRGECAGNWQHAHLHIHCVAVSSHLLACLTAPCTVAVLPNCDTTHCGWCTGLTSLLWVLCVQSTCAASRPWRWNPWTQRSLQQHEHGAAGKGVRTTQNEHAGQHSTVANSMPSASGPCMYSFHGVMAALTPQTAAACRVPDSPCALLLCAGLAAVKGQPPAGP